MKTFSKEQLSDLFWYEWDLLPYAVDMDCCTVEAAMATGDEYKTYMDELELEWTPGKLKEFIVEQYRIQYAKAKAHIDRLEVQNRDQRVQGVSYSERKALSEKIRAGYGVLSDIEQRGSNAKRATYSIRNLVLPTDVQNVQDKGVERHLFYRVLFP